MTGGPVTDRLYQRDSYATQFEAVVSAVVGQEGRAGVILDATLFYPESGGQPCDQGTLGGLPVEAVVERGDAIVHVVGGEPGFGPGDRVRGVVDWTRRLVNMQQHTGQHVLSQAFEQVLGASTVSSSLGTEHSTIDVSKLGLGWEDMARVEDLANRVVYENRPVEVREVPADEAGDLRVKKTGRPGKQRPLLRVVEVCDFDRSPCGGTHLRTTGEVGHIKIVRWEKVREATRVEFLCGMLAGRDYFWKNRFVVDLAQKLTTSPTNLPDIIDGLVESNKDLRKTVASLRSELAGHRIEGLRATARKIGSTAVIAASFDDLDLADLRRLALAAVQPGGTVALFSARGDRVQFVFSRSEGVPVDMREAMKAACDVVGGRGGGRPEVAQGGGEDAERAQEAMEKALIIVRAALADIG